MNAPLPVWLHASLSVAMALGALCAAGAAHAQWAWQDASGVTTYSDTPPPSDVPPASIVQRPDAPSATGSHSARGQDTRNQGYQAPSAAPAAPNAPPPGSAPPGPGGRPPAGGSKSWAEQDADFRKRMADRQKTEQKQAEDDAAAQQKTAACAQARGYQQALESGTRLLRPDADGNRNFLDDEQRAAELRKAQEAIASNC